MRWQPSTEIELFNRYGMTTAIAIGLIMLSSYSHTISGLYGFSFYGSVFALTAWHWGRGPSFWGLAIVWLGLSYFILEGEGFAIASRDDAQRMVMMLVSSGVSILLVGYIRDRSLLLVSALETTDRQYQSALLRLNELTHRVHNDLSTLSAVANLQASASTVPETQSALHSVRDRIHVFSSLYRKLGVGGSERSSMDAAGFITALCDDLRKLHAGLRPISIQVNSTDVALTPHRAMMVGIMLNESVTNAFKYAFPDNRKGNIEVTFEQVGDNSLCLSVRDDGVGAASLCPSKSGMGSRIMNAMSSQLGGTYVLERVDNHTVSKVCFPAQ